MKRYIYGEDPASQNDFFGIVIHELPEIEIDNQTPLPLLRDIYALNNTSHARSTFRLRNAGSEMITGIVEDASGMWRIW